MGSYLNSIRQDVSIKRALLEKLGNEIFPKYNILAEQQLTQLRAIANNTLKSAQNTEANLAVLKEFTGLVGMVIDKRYPTNTFIKENFDKDILHRNNIFVDEDVQKRNMSHTAVLNGSCKGTLLFDGFSICDLYVRHDSEVTIDCSQYCKIFINVYDRAKVNVMQKGIASVYVYIHGEDCVVETEGGCIAKKKPNVVSGFIVFSK